ncbi:MAG: DUF2267 domain-containing protein [Candidatus Margulisiibacteriota bacterium]|nr:MAG: hypothetical protein A2X43_12670 [Candidatus Margulisbacteria bacterium GWD2_39_127]OGI02842.1 MAG: hypothetical protein A2X42_02080 [Candidatus Margulisbacteria bacterium GWF2_38_17]OGI09623.1 MAG: hypothetical protein A2X41_04790 [Candidatus Margulisbacteria bacterium GWE2_39_32]PZM83053.1 MAG: DUF2267 domain-containing protein [Candidatus Margulisiibacteriota bacterium]HAR63671.1 DUF2267 domain-containing protein [Candidatus Margulisiibacteriota bacterium]
MDYQEFIREVESLDFIKDQETADAAIKASLGILVSRIPEPQAKKLAEELPDPLTYEKLRSHQKGIQLSISVDETVAELSKQFGFNNIQSRQLLNIVFGAAKDAVGDDTIDDIEEKLPDDWVEMLEAA